MSLKKNILANYLGQLYIGGISIMLAPIYLRHMGAEVYGLIAFYVLLQVWFQLLDFGLTHATAREVASYRGNASSPTELIEKVQIIERFFLCMAFIGMVIFSIFSDTIAGNWLNSENLPNRTVSQCLILMILAIAIRWIGGVYRGIINGFEKIIWLNASNAAFATLRFVFVIPLMVYFHLEPEEFFLLQLLFASTETFILKIKTKALLPYDIINQSTSRLALTKLNSILSFSTTLAVTNTLWALAMQSDKLILSNSLSLSEYGNFSIAVLIASGITLLAMPVTSALQPRLTILTAQHNLDSIYELYIKASALISKTSVTTGIFLFVFSSEILSVWTKNNELSANLSFVTGCYAIGNSFAALRAVTFTLQYSKGILKLYLFETLLYLLLSIPTLIFLVKWYGINGAGLSWLFCQTAFFVTWTPIVHKKFSPGIHFKWLKATGKTAILALMISYIEHSILNSYISSTANWSLRLSLITISFLVLVGVIHYTDKRTFNLA